MGVGTRAVSSMAVLVSTTLAIVGGTGVADAAGHAGYRVTASPGGGITSTVTNATFSPTPGALAVTDPRGTVLDRIPTSVVLNGVTVPLRTTVAADRRTATIDPVLNPALWSAIEHGRHPASARKDRAYYDMLFHVANGLNRAGTVSAAAGAGVGTAVGAAVGLVVGCTVFGACLLAIPAAAAGAAIGGTVAGVVGTQYGDPRAAQSVLTWLSTR
ncbi:hypothetical protein [Williamsia deligens]|uniref:DUF8020 domain-containing protein n=1 Tax=Williamsia deligens TaxID=321325 RepID=A0ABW3GAS6_9NOCA|nr:hypothetical protein [Williamsia deligens]